MLYEIKNVKQLEGQDFRRWFTDEYFDLFVWYDKNGKISSFQLTYDKGHKERAVTWTRKGGIRHSGIDDGEADPMSSMTPILETDGEFDNLGTAEMFRKASGNLEQKLSAFILGKIANFFADRGRTL